MRRAEAWGNWRGTVLGGYNLVKINCSEAMGACQDCGIGAPPSLFRMLLNRVHAMRGLVRCLPLQARNVLMDYHTTTSEVRKKFIRIVAGVSCRLIGPPRLVC